MKILKRGLILLILMLSACRQTAELEAAAEYVPADESDDISNVIEYGEVNNIESVFAVYSDTWPEDIQIVIEGFLFDNCTEITMIKPLRDENNFTVKIYTKRDTRAKCTTTPEPFKEKITLNTSQLEGGNYRVDVYGRSAQFSLDKLPDYNDKGG
ncbi:MAG: hypothetical protein J7K66_02895 [Anaerolineaceae bacterium]|nr:hypothetical protein [Anaerolineaceae bacterium]